MAIKRLVFGGVAVALLATTALSEIRPSLNFAGVTGLIDMPSGDQQSDGALSATKSIFGPMRRTTLTFQITPRLSGSFRYTGVKNWDDVVPSDFGTYYDRSFDVRYQVFTESRFMPAITVGFSDVIGTGLYSGEYVAATKTFGDKLKVTGGLGWGRYGSSGSIGAPFGPREKVDFGLGGKPRLGQWFKGDMAPFAGVEWQVNKKLTFKAEYSSDGYVMEADTRGTFDRKNSLNYGLEYGVGNTFRLGLYSLYGSQIGISAQIVLDPKQKPTGGVLGPGPIPIKSRPAASSWPAEWVNDKGSLTAMRDKTQKLLAHDGIVLEALSVTANTAQLRIRNTQLDNAPQAIGRSARALAAVLPASVETFEIVPVAEGVALSKVVIRRTDLETLEFAAGQDGKMLARTQIVGLTNDLPENTLMGAGLYPKFTWGLKPYLRTSVFDPAAPIMADFGIQVEARYDLRPGLFVSGTVSKKIVGNLGSSTRESNSLVFPHVRTDANKYAAQGDPALDKLTLAWMTKPAPNLFSRVTVGYLERMYGGVSTELLWQRPDKPFAFGIEVNYAKQRDFNQLLGFQDFGTVTGHVSGYYAFDAGYLLEVDVGRYLAGDVGATVSIDREFANGWKVGAFATLTDMPFETFGEGSFDKGIRLQIPMAWIMGKPTQKSLRTTLRPLLRDGGARLSVDDRLYETIHQFQGTSLDAAWGRFWQ